MAPSSASSPNQPTDSSFHQHEKNESPHNSSRAGEPVQRSHLGVTSPVDAPPGSSTKSDNGFARRPQITNSSYRGATRPTVLTREQIRLASPLHFSARTRRRFSFGGALVAPPLAILPRSTPPRYPTTLNNASPTNFHERSKNADISFRTDHLLMVPTAVNMRLQQHKTEEWKNPLNASPPSQTSPLEAACNPAIMQQLMQTVNRSTTRQFFRSAISSTGTRVGAIAFSNHHGAKDLDVSGASRGGVQDTAATHGRREELTLLPQDNPADIGCYNGSPTPQGQLYPMNKRPQQGGLTEHECQELKDETAHGRRKKAKVTLIPTTTALSQHSSPSSEPDRFYLHDRFELDSNDEEDEFFAQVIEATSFLNDPYESLEYQPPRVRTSSPGPNRKQTTPVTPCSPSLTDLFMSVKRETKVPSPIAVELWAMKNPAKGDGVEYFRHADSVVEKPAQVAPKKDTKQSFKAGPSPLQIDFKGCGTHGGRGINSAEVTTSVEEGSNIVSSADQPPETNYGRFCRPQPDSLKPLVDVVLGNLVKLSSSSRSSPSADFVLASGTNSAHIIVLDKEVGPSSQAPETTFAEYEKRSRGLVVTPLSPQGNTPTKEDVKQELTTRNPHLAPGKLRSFALLSSSTAPAKKPVLFDSVALDSKRERIQKRPDLCLQPHDVAQLESQSGYTEIVNHYDHCEHFLMGNDLGDLFDGQHYAGMSRQTDSPLLAHTTAVFPANDCDFGLLSRSCSSVFSEDEMMPSFNTVQCGDLQVARDSLSLLLETEKATFDSAEHNTFCLDEETEDAFDGLLEGWAKISKPNIALPSRIRPLQETKNDTAAIPFTGMEE